MSGIQNKKKQDELRPEYKLSEFLSKGVRGKYASRYHSGTNLILLAPDVAKSFPDDEAVNESLRLVIKLGKIKKSRPGRKKVTRK